MTRLYRRRTVCELTTLSESTLRRKEQSDPDAPQPIWISKGRIAYIADQVHIYYRIPPRSL